MNVKIEQILAKIPAGAIGADMNAVVHMSGNASFHHNSALSGGEKSRLDF